MNNDAHQPDPGEDIIPDAQDHQRRRLWFITCQSVVLASHVLRFALVITDRHSAVLEQLNFSFVVALLLTSLYYFRVGERFMAWGGVASLIFILIAQPPVFNI